MMKNIHNKLKDFIRYELYLLNKSELSGMFNCNSINLDRYLKISSAELVPEKSSIVYKSLLGYYKSIVIEKVDTYRATDMTVYKFTYCLFCMISW